MVDSIRRRLKSMCILFSKHVYAGTEIAVSASQTLFVAPEHTRKRALLALILIPF